MNLLSCEIIEPRAKRADAAVIWLHGLGASGHDFVPIVPELKLPEAMAVRFVFPHAPVIPVTINGGMMMPAWYDILAMGGANRQLDHSQLMGSAEAIGALIDRERSKGIASSRIVLAGFSQGGAVAYHAAFTYPDSLAGLMAMSTYFPTHKTIEQATVNTSLPVHIFHGKHDPVVPESMGLDALAALKALGCEAEYQSYPMEHEVHPLQIRDISTWLQKVLN